MKKLGFIIIPLMTISILVSCGTKPQVAEHFVTFESNGGTHIDTQRVKDGEKATPPSVNPTRGDDTFLGWFTDFEKEYTFTEIVTNDITLYAGWEVAPTPTTTHHFKFTGSNCSINGFKESFECDLAIGAQTQFKINVENTYSLPTNDEEHFKIIKGDNVIYDEENGLIKITNMVGDIEIEAVAIKNPTKTYTITWLNYDGTVLKTDNNVEEGTTPVYEDKTHETPTRESDPYYDYKFKGWLPSITEARQNQTYVANYETIPAYDTTYFKVEIVKPNTVVRFEFEVLSSFEVDWGDEIKDSKKIHTYTEVGTYRIRINGIINNLYSINNICIKEANLQFSVTNFTFAGCTGLKSIYIPNHGFIENIMSSAFEGCTGLTSVNIPDTVLEIGDHAFKGCTSLTSIDIPNNVIIIRNHAFEGCTSLTSITIPNSVATIEEMTFSGCTSLTSITIPSGVATIEAGAFSECNALESITVDSNNTRYDSRDGCNAIIKTTSDTLVVGCKNTIIPNSVEGIGIKAFYKCTSLTSITIPSSIYSIYENAFVGCSGLESITVDSNNTRYDSRDGCNAIIETNIDKLIAGCKNTIIPNSVSTIDEFAFDGCASLTSITIPSNVTLIKNNAFEGCSGLESITVDSNNTTYDSRDGCNAIIETDSNTLVVGCKSTIFPNSVPTIGKSAFSGCTSLTSITIPSGINLIYNNAFAGCSGLESITVDSNNTTYDSRDGCNAIIETDSNILVVGCKNAIIPNSVIAIGTYAFDKNNNLTSITIPNNVILIDDYSFDECFNLKVLDLTSYTDGSVPNLTDSAFDNYSHCIEIYVSNGMKEVFEKARQWSAFYGHYVEVE